MRRSTIFLVTGSLLLLAACSSRTVVVQQPGPVRQPRASRPPPNSPPGPEAPLPAPPTERRNEVLIPPGHLPDPGECRVWIPGTPPGRQPRPRSRACAGIEAIAPAGSWILYRRADDRRLLYIRIIDDRRPGIVTRNRIIDLDSWELIREEDPLEQRRGDDRPGQERPRDDRQPPPVQPPPGGVQPPGNRPPEPKPPEPRPPEQRPTDQRPVPPPEIIRPIQPPPGQQPPPVQPPVNPPPADSSRPVPPPPPAVSEVTLKIPPGHLPDLGECRVWRPTVPPGLQSRPKSRSCTGINSVAPAGSWILYRPSNDPKVLHLRIVDERRAGVVVTIQVFDLDSKRLLREEKP